MNARNGHLSSDRLKELLIEMQVESSGEQLSTIDRSEQEHLTTCEFCRERFHMYRSTDQKLASLRLHAGALRGLHCPPETLWMRVVAGLEIEEAAEGLLEHAADCDYCGALLRQATEDFADKLTSNENDRLANLQSTKLEWQQNLARKYAESCAAAAFSDPRETTSTAKGLSAWPRYLYAAAAAAVLAAAVGVGIWRWFYPSAQTAERLLAEAYTEQRTMELRFPGARYAPLRVERGGERSRLSRPRALLDGEALIARELTAHPNDPAWLAAAGRAELLEWQYDAAIESFNRALETQPDSSSLLTGVATAYFQRGQAQDRAQDYAKAIDLLGQSLSHQPNDSVALFNRAIANERMFLYHEALDDWQALLRTEPRGEWADEARQRREALLQKMKPRERPEAGLLRDPRAAAAALRARAEAKNNSKDWRSSLDEAYLDVAVYQWLPALYPSHNSAGAAGHPSYEREALLALAAVLKRYHSDDWLRDLLRDNLSSHWIAGIQKLSAAVRTNAEGDADHALSLASQAESHFRTARIIPGALRARLEYVVALKSAQKGSQCLEAALGLLHELQKYRYSWIQANALLETSTCYGLIGDAGMAQEFTWRAVAFTRGAGYGFLHLLSLCYDDGVSVGTSGVWSPQAWSRVRSALRQFWEAPYQPQIAGALYPDLNRLAEGAGFWHLAELAGHEIVFTASQGENHTFEAVSHHWLGQDLQMAGDLRQAETEFELASRLFASLPPTPASRSSWAAMEIYRASLEIQRGDWAAARARLLQVQSTLPEIAHSDVSVMYYECLGELYLRRGDVDPAEHAFRAAIHISELGLTSLPAELDRLSWEREAGKAYRGLAELYFQRYHDPLKALEFWEWYRAAPLRARLGAAPAARTDFSTLDTNPDLPAIPSGQSFLPSLSSETVISFASFPAGLAIWAYDNRGIVTNWVAVPSDELNKVARRYARMCSDPSSDVLVLNRDARQLYDWLIAPVVAKLDPGRALIVEPDAPFSKIPLQALMDPGGEYLNRRFSIAVSPGLGYFQRLRPRALFSRQQRMLVVGDPVLSGQVVSDFPPLPDADREARQVAGKFHQAQLLMSAKATLEKVEGELPRADLFHFAGHALSGGTHPGLLLSAATSDGPDDLPLPLLDATKLSPKQTARARLVVLSACETATAEKGLVDPDSLVRAFLRGGVPHVVATRWRVDSRTTAEMIDAFYSNLLEGKRVARALQLAAEQVRSRPATSHPYFWAAFAAFGR